jgi:hypothetical protein
LSLEILRKSGDPNLSNLLASVIRPSGPQIPLRDQLTAAHAEIAELRPAKCRASSGWWFSKANVCCWFDNVPTILA